MSSSPLRRLVALLGAGVLAAPFLVAGADGGHVSAGDGRLQVGFGSRAITPVGEPPEEWSEYFTPHPETGLWGEPYEDLNGDGCYSGLTNEDLGPVLDGEAPPGAAPEPFVDQPWNSAGDTQHAGVFKVREVTIVGDPDSTGKWDGLWGNAGFGAICAQGAKDDTWARAVVLQHGDRTVAMVSLDVVGLFNLEVRRAREELAARYPEMPIDELVISSTHTHEGVDTMGYWGQLFLNTDGKFPAYQAFIRSQIIDAVHEAYMARQPAMVKLAHGQPPVPIRDSRPPEVTDPEVLAAQFLTPDLQTTIGTIVNWSNHPEAQGSGNPLISSDFPHATRERLEEAFGGTAVYFSGAVGGLQTPLGVDIPGYGSSVSWERTYAIGDMVAESAIEALRTAPPRRIDHLDARRREFIMDADNNVLRALNVRGIFDLPTFVGAVSHGPEDQRRDGVPADRLGPQNRTEMVLVELGSAMFLTVPGELSPEIELGGFGRPDCPEADTGRPYEPTIAGAYDQEFRFVLGLGQDELGYIIPGYDFHLMHAPADVAGGPAVVPLGGLEVEWCGQGHYEETVSISSTFAPWVACVAVELSGSRDPWELGPQDLACSADNLTTNPYGVRTDITPDDGAAAAARLRHAIRASHGHSHLPASQTTSPDAAPQHQHGDETHTHP